MNAEMKALFFNIFNAVAASLADDFVCTEHVIALTDSDIFLPAELPNAVTGTVDFSAWSPVKRIRGLTFSGNSGGARARITMFGINLNEDGDTTSGADGLLLPAESAAVTTIVNELNSHAKGGNGLQATFHNRATIKANDRLLKLVRRGLIG
jgi:hypothetical protein